MFEHFVDMDHLAAMEAAKCKHLTTTRSPNSPYEYCEECGAVRQQEKNGTWSRWHSCPVCVMQAKKSFVVD